MVRTIKSKKRDRYKTGEEREETGKAKSYTHTVRQADPERKHPYVTIVMGPGGAGRVGEERDALSPSLSRSLFISGLTISSSGPPRVIGGKGGILAESWAACLPVRNLVWYRLACPVGILACRLISNGASS